MTKRTADEEIESLLNNREVRRERANDRYFDMLDRTHAACEALVGELIREGRKVFYINLTTRDGRLTGKTKESADAYDLYSYLRRNKYV